MDASLRLALLRVIMVADGIVLGLFGLGLILTPRAMFTLFKLDLPPAAGYIAGLWGALLLTLAAAYVMAARQPLRNLVLVQIGIVRALLETAVSLFYVGSQAITLEQAAAGIFLAVWFAIAYILLFPQAMAYPEPPHVQQ